MTSAAADPIRLDLHELSLIPQAVASVDIRAAIEDCPPDILHAAPKLRRLLLKLGFVAQFIIAVIVELQLVMD
jgi:hypothetical protein